MENTIESKFLIANFMGHNYPSIDSPVFKVNLYDLHDYDDSWNKLMPVVERIKEFGKWTLEPDFAKLELYRELGIGNRPKERVKFFTSQMNWETENDEPVEWIFLVHHIVVQFIKWYNKYYGIELKSQVATGMPASTSLEGCPFHYCDNNPKCEGTCRYNSTLTTSQSKTNNNEK